MNDLFSLVEPITQDSSRNPADNRVRRHIVGHDSAGPNNRPIADRHASYEDGPMPHKDIRTNVGHTRRRATGKYDRGTRLFTVMVASNDRDISR